MTTKDTTAEKVTHTPGPWRISDSPIECIVSDAHGCVVCMGHDYNECGLISNEADARLIAAAPDLLEAIKEYLNWGAMTSSDRDLFTNKFRAVLAKAEGRS